MRQTKQKLMIMDAIRKMDGHPSAEEIYLSLKPDNPQLSLATVYRNLNEFCERGLLRRVEVPNEPVRFDKHLHNHFHGVCERCKKIINIPARKKKSLQDCIGMVKEMEVTRYNLLIYGICEECRDQE